MTASDSLGQSTSAGKFDVIEMCSYYQYFHISLHCFLIIIIIA